jgi:hypothetical protein
MAILTTNVPLDMSTAFSDFTDDGDIVEEDLTHSKVVYSDGTSQIYFYSLVFTPSGDVSGNSILTGIQEFAVGGVLEGSISGMSVVKTCT